MSIECKKTPLSTEKGKKDLMPVVYDKGPFVRTKIFDVSRIIVLCFIQRSNVTLVYRFSSRHYLRIE